MLNSLYEIFIENYVKLFEGLGYTLLLAFVGTIAGLILGIIICTFRNLNSKPQDNSIIKILKFCSRSIATIYIEVLRGTPMMVQAMIFFFGGYSLGILWDPLVCGLVVISINTSAYMAEIIRSGLNGINKGQIDAARSLGLTHLQTMVMIVYPQALKNVIPTLGNELIVNIKDSSVLNVIFVTELFFVGNIIVGENYMNFEVNILIAMMYLSVTVICSLVLKVIERHLDDSRPTRKKYTNIFRKRGLANETTN